jgi:hypothetical protein
MRMGMRPAPGVVAMGRRTRLHGGRGGKLNIKLHPGDAGFFAARNLQMVVPQLELFQFALQRRASTPKSMSAATTCPR